VWPKVEVVPEECVKRARLTPPESFLSAQLQYSLSTILQFDASGNVH
jgi:hypothetical protein